MLDMARGGGSESTFGMSLMELLQYTVASKSKLRAAKGEAELMKGKAAIMGAQAEMAKAAAAQTQAEAAMQNANKLSPELEKSLFSRRDEGSGGSRQGSQGANAGGSQPGGELPPGPGSYRGNPFQGSGGNQAQRSDGTIGPDRFNVFYTQEGKVLVTNKLGDEPPGSASMSPTGAPLSGSDAGKVSDSIKQLQREGAAWDAISGTGATTPKAEASGQPSTPADSNKEQGGSGIPEAQQKQLEKEAEAIDLYTGTTEKKEEDENKP